MTCRNFQYEEDKEYEEQGKIIEVCKHGFHACEDPMDCFNYYNPCDSIYHEVEQSGEIDRNDDDSKVASSKIKIGARLDIAGLCKAKFEYVKSRCTMEHTDPCQATAGDCGAATAGNRGAATSRGSSATGKNGLSVARGNDVKVKGGLGAVLVLCKENDYDIIKEWKAEVVDGERIKADTWYKLVDGKFKEVEE